MASNDRPPFGPEGSTTRQRTLRDALAVGLLALALNLAGNGRVGLWDRDEPRYAACTREMRARGDWVFPTFNAEPRYHKPVLIYWLMRAGMALGGDNPFGARLVSALAGAGTCLVVWAWGRRVLGDRAGLLAGLILATTPLVVVESKLATTDATLMLWVVVCQCALWELSQRPSRGAAAVFWTALGLAVLTKSPAGPALIATSGLASWWWGGPTSCWKRLRWRWGPLLCAAIVVPWHAAILLRSQGDYLRVAVGYHIVSRMTTGIEGHGGFPGYYAVLSWLTCLPWSALLPAALVGAWSRRRASPVFGFLLGWVVGPLAFLECVRTKLIHYYLPAVPAWALLIAWLVVAVAESGVRFESWPRGRPALRALAGCGIAAGTGLPVAAWFAPPALRGPLLAVWAVVAAGAVFIRTRVRGGDMEQAAHGLIATAAACAFVVGAWLLPAAEPFRLSGAVGRHLAALEARERAQPVLYSCQLPGVVYALGHPAPVLRTRASLVECATRAGKVVATLSPTEFAAVRADPRLSVELRATVRGVNVEYARTEVVHLAVIRPNPRLAEGPSLPTLAR